MNCVNRLLAKTCGTLFLDRGGNVRIVSPFSPEVLTQVLCAELRVAHASAVLGDVVGALGGFRAGVRVAAQGGEQAVDAALLEVVAAGFGARLVLRLVAAEERLGRFPKLFLRVPGINNLDGAGAVLVGNSPNQMLRATFDLSKSTEPTSLGGGRGLAAELSLQSIGTIRFDRLSVAGDPSLGRVCL